MTSELVNQIILRMLYSIDPGLRGCGVAAWEHDEPWASYELMWACYLPAESPYEGYWRGAVNAVANKIYFDATELAIELPQVYDRARSKGDPNDLIQLAAVVGGIVDRLGRKTAIYLPREWKKQVPKKIMCERIESRLSEVERAEVELPASAKLKLDVWDAVGIGLHHLGRL